jgi:thiol-disulfide isomerase/thioredoxin
LDLELQLSTACASHDHADVSAAESELSTLASQGPPAMRDAAALAFYQCRCSGHDLPVETAASVMQELEPTSIITRLWPQGYGTMLARVVAPGDLPDRVMRLANEGRPDLGAHALVAAAKHEAPSESAGVLEARKRLSQPPWKDTYVAKFQPQVMIQRDLEVDLQTWTVELSDGTVASIPIGSGPTLVYLTAAYCGACRAAAPKLRKLAAAHPKVEIVYLVWDGAVDELTSDHLPIPGTLAVPTEEFRESWRAAFGEPSLPGFVAIIDRTHAVAHSSNASLSQAFEILTEHRIDTPPAAPDTAVR